MNRRLRIAAVALVVMAGLFLYDRGNRTETVIPATVVSVDDRDDAAGPDTWHVTVRTSTGDRALEPVLARPDLSPGDTLCITVIGRMGRPDEVHRAPQSATC